MVAWSVFARFSRPTDEIPLNKIQTEELADALRDRMEPMRVGVVSAGADEFDVTFGADAETAETASAFGVATLKVVLAGLGGVGLARVGDWPIVALDVAVVEGGDTGEALSGDLESLLIGQIEVAKILGLSKQRVSQLASEHPDFPPAIGPSRRQLWLRPAVEAFSATWDRTPGRPSRLREVDCRVHLLDASEEVVQAGARAHFERFLPQAGTGARPSGWGGQVGPILEGARETVGAVTLDGVRIHARFEPQEQRADDGSDFGTFLKVSGVGFWPF